MLTCKIRGINRVRRGQRTYWYHRATGKRVDIDPVTGERFDPTLNPMRCAALVAQFDADSSFSLEVPDVMASTLGELISFYKRSPEFAGLATATRRTYDIAFDKFSQINIFEMPLHVVESHGSPIIIKIRNRILRDWGWWQANYSVAVLRLLFSWAKPYGHMKTNPAIGVQKLKRSKDKPRLNRAWSDLEVQAVLDEATRRNLWGVRAAVALGLARLSRADIVRFPWASFNGSEIDTARHKTGVSLWKPCPELVRDILHSTPREYRLGRRTQGKAGAAVRVATTVVANQHGLPYTDSGLSATFRKVVASLLKRGVVQPGLTLHGLGHTVGKWLAESGATTKQIQAFLGHDSPAASEFYLKSANQKALARDAVVTLERTMNRFAKTS